MSGILDWHKWNFIDIVYPELCKENFADIFCSCTSELCKENFADDSDMTEEEVEEELAIIR